MLACYTTSGRVYQDPLLTVDDYGNLVDHWEVVWEHEWDSTTAACMYFKHGYTNIWPETLS